MATLPEAGGGAQLGVDCAALIERVVGSRLRLVGRGENRPPEISAAPADGNAGHARRHAGAPGMVRRMEGSVQAMAQELGAISGLLAEQSPPPP